MQHLQTFAFALEPIPRQMCWLSLFHSSRMIFIIQLLHVGNDVTSPISTVQETVRRNSLFYKTFLAQYKQKKGSGVRATARREAFRSRVLRVHNSSFREEVDAVGGADPNLFRRGIVRPALAVESVAFPPPGKVHRASANGAYPLANLLHEF